MPQNYVPIFLFIAVIGVLIPLTLVLARVVRTQNPHRTKLMPYECGIDPVDNARGRYTVRTCNRDRSFRRIRRDQIEWREDFVHPATPNAANARGNPRVVALNPPQVRVGQHVHASTL